MMKPNEVAAINVQEHLKIVITEKTTYGNVSTIITKTAMSQRVK